MRVRQSLAALPHLPRFQDRTILLLQSFRTQAHLPNTVEAHPRLQVGQVGHPGQQNLTHGHEDHLSKRRSSYLKRLFLCREQRLALEHHDPHPSTSRQGSFRTAVRAVYRQPAFLREALK
jgi:hypothetical protein